MRFSPRLDAVLVETVRRADVERMSIAEVWRQASEAAERLGLCRPGYHSILAIVIDERRRREQRREALADAAGELWAYKGVDYATLARRLADLPPEARAYLDRLQDLAGTAVRYVSVGTRRDQIIEV